MIDSWSEVRWLSHDRDLMSSQIETLSVGIEPNLKLGGLLAKLLDLVAEQQGLGLLQRQSFEGLLIGPRAVAQGFFQALGTLGEGLEVLAQLLSLASAGDILQDRLQTVGL
jgi:hypothetical protein